MEENRKFWDSIEILPDDPKDLEEFQNWMASKGEPTKEELIDSLEALFLSNKEIGQQKDLLVSVVIELQKNRVSTQEFIQNLVPNSFSLWLMNWRTGVLLMVAIVLALFHVARGWLSR